MTGDARPVIAGRQPIDAREGPRDVPRVSPRSCDVLADQRWVDLMRIAVH